MATHSSILSLRIPWTEEPGGLHTVHGVAKSQTPLNDGHFHFSRWEIVHFTAVLTLDCCPQSLVKTN